MNDKSDSNSTCDGLPRPWVEQDDASVSGYTHERSCLNCGTELIGEHCHGCGQKAHVHRTIGALLHDIAHGVLHLEGRAWRTLPLLAWRPGELTRRYIDGERTRFVSPMAIFLFSIFLMFAFFQLSGITSPADIGVPTVQADAAQVENHASAGAGRVNDFSIGNPREGTSLSVRKTGWAWLDKGLLKWHDNPSLMLYKFQSNSYKFSWLLILISIPFVWLLFVGNARFKSYDHAVFITYSISFMTILMVLLSALYKIGVPALIVAAAAMIVPPIHIYRDLRHTYRLAALAAFWRLAALLLFISIIVALFLQLLWLIGIAS